MSASDPKRPSNEGCMKFHCIMPVCRFAERGVRVGLFTLVGCIAACTGSPRMEVDVDDLGRHRLGQLVAKTWMLSEARLQAKVREEVVSAGTACLASVACLKSFGFSDCIEAASGIRCDYVGDILAVVVKPKGVRVGNRIRVNIDIQVAPDGQVAVGVGKSGSI